MDDVGKTNAYEHWCGKQGYGLGINDVCPACYAAELRKRGTKEIEIHEAIARAVASISY